MRKRKTAARMTASALAVCMVAGSLFTGAAEVQAADPSETDWEAVRSVVSRYYGEWDQIQDSQVKSVSLDI